MLVMRQESEEEKLRVRSLLNRAAYQQKIVDAAQAQEEQSSATQYAGFNSETGLARLRDANGNIVYGNAQTNGAIALGENIRLRRGGVVAGYDAMPRTRKLVIEENPDPKFYKVVVLFYVYNDITNEYCFYAGGDRSSPKLLAKAPATATTILYGAISNLGNKKFNCSIKTAIDYNSATPKYYLKQISGQGESDYLLNYVETQTQPFTKRLFHTGEGTWIGLIRTLMFNYDLTQTNTYGFFQTTLFPFSDLGNAVNYTITDTVVGIEESVDSIGQPYWSLEIGEDYNTGTCSQFVIDHTGETVTEFEVEHERQFRRERNNDAFRVSSESFSRNTRMSGDTPLVEKPFILTHKLESISNRNPSTELGDAEYDSTNILLMGENCSITERLQLKINPPPGTNASAAPLDSYTKEYKFIQGETELSLNQDKALACSASNFGGVPASSIVAGETVIFNSAPIAVALPLNFAVSTVSWLINDRVGEVLELINTDVILSKYVSLNQKYLLAKCTITNIQVLDSGNSVPRSFRFSLLVNAVDETNFISFGRQRDRIISDNGSVYAFFLRNLLFDRSSSTDHKSMVIPKDAFLPLSVNHYEPASIISDEVYGENLFRMIRRDFADFYGIPANDEKNNTLLILRALESITNKTKFIGNKLFITEIDQANKAYIEEWQVLDNGQIKYKSVKTKPIYPIPENAFILSHSYHP